MNRAQLSHYDRVQAGAALTIVSRNSIVGVDNQAPPPAPALVSSVAPIEEKPAVVEVPSITTPEPVVVDTPETTETTESVAIQEPVMDPIPETPAAPAPMAQELVVTQSPKAGSESGIGASALDSANIRRVIYVAMILSIALVAFYMTRPSKKQKFDMLDVTTSDTSARQRLGDKDSHHKDIG